MTLDIATAPRAASTTWHRGTTTWAEVCAWEPRAGGKDGPGYVLGLLSEPRRAKETVTSRGVLVLDPDHLTAATRAGLLAKVRALGCSALVHSTYTAPRLRVLVLLSRPVTPDEYAILADWLMDRLGVSLFDRSCREASRFMYSPTLPSEGDYYHEVMDGAPFDVEMALDLAQMAPAPEPTTPAPLGPESVPEDHVRTEVGWVLAQLDALAALAEGARLSWPGQADGVGWDLGVFLAAQRLVESANCGTGYTLADAEADFREHAPASAGTYDRDHKWAEAVKATAGRPLPYESPSDVFEPVNEPSLRLALPVRMRLHVARDYDVFPATDDGRIFAQPKAGGRAELLGGGFVIRACRDVGSRSASFSTAATEAARVLAALAEDNPPRPLSLRVHHRPGRIVLDMAQPDSTMCAVVTADGWSVQPAPPPDVVFARSGRPLPTPVHGGDLDELRTLLHWEPDDPRWPLVKGWLPAALLASVPRPMLAFLGPQGGGKTTAARMVVGVLDPKPDGVLGSGFGKSKENDETKALGSYLPAWDNVSNLSGDGADFLSRLVTGDMIEKRRLYTDADLVTIQYRRTGAITGVTLPRGVKPDTLDRLVLVLCDERPLVVLPEATLTARWEQAHPRVLGAVLTLASRMLAGLGSPVDTRRLRMADYAQALAAMGPALLEAYEANVRTARADMAQDDPFVQVLRDWLVSCRDGTFEGTAAQAHTAAGLYVDSGQWWPNSPRAFTDTVTRTSELLPLAGITVSPPRRNHGRLIRTYSYCEVGS